MLAVVLLAGAAAACGSFRVDDTGSSALAAVALVAATFFQTFKFLVRYPRSQRRAAQDSAAILLGTDMRLTRFDPRSMLVVSTRRSSERCILL